MTVADLAVLVQYDGGDADTLYPVPCQYLAAAQVVVTRIDSAGARATLTGYALTGDGRATPPTGTVQLATDETGNTIEIERVTPITQPVLFTDREDFPSDLYQDQQDRIAMAQQELSAGLDRSIRVKRGQSVADLDMADFAGKALAGSADGDAIVPLTLNDADGLDTLATLADPEAGPELIALGAGTLGDLGAAAAISTYYDSDLREALDARFDDGGTGNRNLNIPAGEWEITTGFTMSADRTLIQGAGKYGTTLAFAPVAPAACLTYGDGSSDGILQSTLRDIGITSDTDGVTGVHLENVANFLMDNVALRFTGAGSVGVRIDGRQLPVLRGVDIAADKPVVIGPNSEWPTLAADFMAIRDAELTCYDDAGSCIEALTDTVLSNITLDNVAMVGGKNGFKAVLTSSDGVSFQLMILGGRTEQGPDPTGWSFDLEGVEQTIQEVIIINHRFDALRNGIKVRRGLKVTLLSCNLPMGAGRTAIDMDFESGSELRQIGCTINPLATVTLANAVKVQAPGDFNNNDVRSDGHWVYRAGTYSGAIESDVPLSGSKLSYTDHQARAICDRSYVGWIRIVTSDNVGARFFVRGSSNTVSERDDPDNFFTATEDNDTTWNFYFDADAYGTGVGGYMLQNETGSTKTARCFLEGGPF